ncbi:hypothetical protein FXB38_23845 [Bradyrhizobium cytisi]|uniref:Uncharacterized protein n=1 Tax=Bradyrhizobium cytisi TaxID=515489 RepID=A0A5S4WLK2_9BRAD|nr:hypothetical protein FXB38_23845 [Bradyrhizobium cytisi]
MSGPRNDELGSYKQQSLFWLVCRDSCARRPKARLHGIPGQPGNKSGPAVKSGETVGSSSTTNQKNPPVQMQDSSNVKGLPGNMRRTRPPGDGKLLASPAFRNNAKPFRFSHIKAVQLGIRSRCPRPYPTSSSSA